MLITTDKNIQTPDPHGRQFTNLRISLTAACNYACTYCVPNGKRLHKAKLELGVTDFLTAIDYLIAATGINKLRITGGEPLISSKFDQFLLGVKDLPLDDISLTTNGQFLGSKLGVIAQANIKRINVSLDTLDHKAFKIIAKSGDLETVLKNIAQAQSYGLKIKINMVPLRRSNYHQIVPMLDYCLENNFELRYIELMRMGHLKHSDDFQQEFVGLDEILNLISQKYSFNTTNAPLNSTAIRYHVFDRKTTSKMGKNLGTFGIIANESAPFCRTCNRLRLSSTGKLYGCLSNSHSHYITPILKEPKVQAVSQLQEILKLAMKDKQPVAFQGASNVMKMIGG